MGKTCIQLAQDITREAKYSGSGPTSLTGNVGQNAHVVDWMQRAWMDLQKRRRNWKWMRKEKTFTTSAGKSNYTLEDLTLRSQDDTKNALGRWDQCRAPIYKTASGPTDRGWLYFKSRQYWNTYDRFISTTQSRPLYYTVLDDRSLELMVAPDTSYTIVMPYWRRPYRFTATTDVPDLPEEHEDIIVWLALVNEATLDDAPEIYAEARRRVEVMMANLERDWLFESEEGNDFRVGADPLA